MNGSTDGTSAAYHLCTPLSNEHRRGMRWFSALAQATQPTQSLKHSVEFYSLFAQTGENEYLKRCEEFLRYTLSAR